MNDKARVVFDCNTFLQAMAAPEGPAGHCVQLALDDQVVLFVSAYVLDELRDVASRPRVARKLHLKSERFDAFLAAIEVAATLIDAVPDLFTYARDPDDAHYVNLALAANARLIVSRDKDLLELMVSGKPESDNFQARFPWLRILDPVGFLREVARQQR